MLLWGVPVLHGGHLPPATAHQLGETSDATRVLPFLTELLASDVPVGAAASPGRLDIGRLLARPGQRAPARHADADGHACRSRDRPRRLVAVAG